MEATMEEILAAREWRAQRQKELLAEHGKTLICFTLNIPGPEKRSDLITRTFGLGDDLLTMQLQARSIPVVYMESVQENAGCVAFYVVESQPETVKALTVELEESLPIGRLFDMDVFAPDGTRLERAGERRCLLCDNSAKVCGRNRAHGLEALVQRTRQLMRDGVWQADAEKVGSLAAKALLFEVCTTPKPGLVDRMNSGSHRDMDIFSFMSSTAALQPYFVRCALVGMETAEQPPEETFKRLRVHGRQAEETMLRATGGVNTHKGAIFSLGVLCGALGRIPRHRWKHPETVTKECAAMTKGLTERELGDITAQTAKTAGERLYAAHGITGVRGQVEAGFPAVLNTGLPVLEQGVDRGRSLEHSGCAALLALMTAAVDTNLIVRSDYEGARKLSREMALLLARNMYPDEENLLMLDELFRENNLSPGGSADLLAVTYFLYFLKNE